MLVLHLMDDSTPHLIQTHPRMTWAGWEYKLASRITETIKPSSESKFFRIMASATHLAFHVLHKKRYPDQMLKGQLQPSPSTCCCVGVREGPYQWYEVHFPSAPRTYHQSCNNQNNLFGQHLNTLRQNTSNVLKRPAWCSYIWTVIDLNSFLGQWY